jgi:hypothetical protein
MKFFPACILPIYLINVGEKVIVQRKPTKSSIHSAIPLPLIDADVWLD